MDSGQDTTGKIEMNNDNQSSYRKKIADILINVDTMSKNQLSTQLALLACEIDREAAYNQVHRSTFEGIREKFKQGA